MLNKNNSKRAYQLVKALTSEKQGRSSTIQDKSGKSLTEENEILSRWTEYCSELYIYESCGDNAVLDCSQPQEKDLQPILREEVEIAVASLKKGKSSGVDNIENRIEALGLRKVNESAHWIVVETMQYWTAASPKKKICNRSSVRRLRLQ